MSERLGICWSCFTTIRISEDELRTIRAALGVLASDYNEGQHDEVGNAKHLIERVDLLLTRGGQ